MTPSEIAASYDRIASVWDGPEFHRANGIAQHERALRFVTHRGAALDVGCGSSGRLIDLLASQGFQPEGLDFSPEMLRLAKQRHSNIPFHQADICHWALPKSYDFITAWDSIWHVPLAAQCTVIEKLCRGLSPGGVFIFTTGGVEQPHEIRDNSMGVPMYHAAPGIPQVLQTLAAAGCACRHLEYDQYPENHVYLIAKKTCH